MIPLPQERVAKKLLKSIKIFFKDFCNYKEFNDVYAEYFAHGPARSSCEATKLPAGASIEMDMIALQ